MAFTPEFVPQTELDAVNQMLLSIGLSPVNTLTVQGIKDVDNARLVLHNTLREVLGKGWNFNTDECYPLSPDSNGKVAIPGNALDADPVEQCDDFVERVDPADDERRFYDRKNRTFVISKQVKCDITWFFEYEAIPQAARAHIAQKAGRIFQIGRKPSQIVYQFPKERELETLVELQRQERRSRDSNFFNHDSVSARIFHRII